MRSPFGPTRALCCAIGILLLVSQALGCERDQNIETKRRAAPRLVMLNVFCTLRKDFLQPYDRSVDFTPHLARLAKDALVFERHVTEAGQSGIAFASIVTGEHAMRHKVYSHPTRLRDALQTLPEAFAKAGYETFFWEHQSMGSIALNYGQGVEPEHAFAREALRAEDPRFIRILKRLSEDSTYKAFVMSFDSSLTHGPYKRSSLDDFCGRYPKHCEGIDPAEAKPAYKHRRAFAYDFPNASRRHGIVEEELVDLAAAMEMIYKSRVYYLDQVYGDLVETVERFGLSGESVLAFTADHGETLYRDNSLFKWSHGFALAPEVVNVPFLLRGPGVEPGRFTTVSGSADVFPILASLADVSIGEGQATMGRNLLAKPGNDVQGELPAVFSHTSMWPLRGRALQRQRHFLEHHPEYAPELIWVAIRSGDLVIKYRSDGEDEMFYQAFDLARDPSERRDIFDRQHPLQRVLVERLARYRRVLVDGHVHPRDDTPKEPDFDEVEMIEQLRALGYVD